MKKIFLTALFAFMSLAPQDGFSSSCTRLQAYALDLIEFYNLLEAGAPEDYQNLRKKIEGVKACTRQNNPEYIIAIREECVRFENAYKQGTNKKSAPQSGHIAELCKIAKERNLGQQNP